MSSFSTICHDIIRPISSFLFYHRNLIQQLHPQVLSATMIDGTLCTIDALLQWDPVSLLEAKSLHQFDKTEICVTFVNYSNEEAALQMKKLNKLAKSTGVIINEYVESQELHKKVTHCIVKELDAGTEANRSMVSTTTQMIENNASMFIC